MIKYIGSKRTLIPEILSLLGQFPELVSATDLFSGTSRVGHALKGAGLRVVSNDHNAYAHTLATCYVQANQEQVERQALLLIDEFNRLPGDPGYVTHTFCEQSRFFQPHNGARIDAIRNAIEAKSLEPNLKAVLLTSLMEAADRVDSTCGLQMAYVKQWAARSYKNLQLRCPTLLPSVAAGPCQAWRLDANEAARNIDTDVVYIDPPYNQHSYLSNYHIWETLVLWDHPKAYGVACKREDCRTRKSDYNSKRRHQQAFADLVQSIEASLMVVSFNDEGYQSRRELEAVLSTRGQVFVVAKDFKRYVGAKIGVFNPAGDRVGDVSHLQNQEYIYLVALDRSPKQAWIQDRLAQIFSPQTLPPITQERPRATPGQTQARPGRARVPLVRQALQELGPCSQMQLRERTGLSGYHVRMGLQELIGRGQAKEEPGAGRKRYSIGYGT